MCVFILAALTATEKKLNKKKPALCEEKSGHSGKEGLPLWSRDGGGEKRLLKVVLSVLVLFVAQQNNEGSGKDT